MSTSSYFLATPRGKSPTRPRVCAGVASHLRGGLCRKDEAARGGVVLEPAVDRGDARAFLTNNMVVLLLAVMRKEIICPPYQDGLLAFGY